MKAEFNHEGRNPRFVVTNLTGATGDVYDDTYTARGQSENYIKDLKHAMFADRLSCHKYDANHFMLLLHTAAYILMFSLREQVHRVEADGHVAADQDGRIGPGDRTERLDSTQLIPSHARPVAKTRAHTRIRG